MLKVHNSKVDKVIGGYHAYMKLRERAQQDGVPFEQLRDEQENVEPKKKKFAVKKKKVPDVGIEIKVKNEDGLIANFEESTDPVAEEVKLEGDDTLAMIQAALESKPGVVKKGKKKGVAKKKGAKKKEAEDLGSRFLTDCGDNPHL